MRFPKKTATQEALERFAKLRGPNKHVQGAMILLASAAASQDRKLLDRSGRLVHQLLLSLNKAFPEVDAQLIGDVVANLSDLWVYGQKLDKHLRALCQMKFPRQREHLWELLMDIKHEQLDEGAFHTQDLKKKLPRLIEDLERRSRQAGRRERVKASKTQRSST